MPKYDYDYDKEIRVMYTGHPGIAEKLRFEIEEETSTRWFDLKYDEAAFLYNRIGEKLETIQNIDEVNFDHVP